MTKPLGEEAVKLLPCPFCGSADVLVITDEDDDGRFAAVGCNDCGAGSRQHYFCGDDAREYAANAWNRRPQPQGACVQVKGLIERLAALEARADREWLDKWPDDLGRGPYASALEEAGDAISKLSDRLAQVEADRDKCLREWENAYREYNSALHQRDAARKALEPFAKIAPSSLYSEDGSEAERYHVVLFDSSRHMPPHDFTGADLARARQALSDLKDTQ